MPDTVPIATHILPPLVLETMLSAWCYFYPQLSVG